MSLMRRIANLFVRSKVESEIEAELRAHIEMRMEDNMQHGMTEQEARRDALVRFGNAAATKERVVGVDAALWLESAWADARYACRGLVKNPGFAVTAIAVLALGVGVVTAIFAFADAVLIKPVPYKEPARLVGLFEKTPMGPRYHLSYADYVAWKSGNKSLSALEAFDEGPWPLKTDAGMELVDGGSVTAGFLRTLGLAPVLGRDFRDGDDAPGAEGVVLLSYSAWQKRFGGRRNVLGESIVVDNEVKTIVGVLPPQAAFSPVGTCEFWTTVRVQTGIDSRRDHGLGAIGRLKDGVSIEQVSEDLDAISAGLARLYPDTNGGHSATVVPLSEVMIGRLRPLLLLMLSGGLLLLVIASVNVASLLLVRTETRRREFSLRGALGASRSRMVRQFCIEAMVLAVAGSAVGLGSAYGFMHLLLGLIPSTMQDDMPYLRGLGLSGHVLWFAAAITLGMMALLAVTPLGRIARGDLRGGLADGGRTAANGVWKHLGANLVVLELGMAMVLLVGAGLLGKSLYKLMHTEIGMESKHLAILRMRAPDAGYATDAQRIGLAQRIGAEVRRLPGVKDVAMAELVPVSSGSWASAGFQIVGRPSHDKNEAKSLTVSANYFSTLEATLLRGRYFRDGEDASKPPVVVVNRTFTQRYFPGEEALGKMIQFDGAVAAMEVVGVVEDIQEGPLDTMVPPVMYRPLEQDPMRNYFVVVRTEQAPRGIVSALSSTVHALDAGILVLDAETMDDRINRSQAAYLHVASAWLASGFASMALLLGVVGLYGVVAYSVSQRTREIGVRMALGAQRSGVYGLILKEAARLVGVGIGVGMVCAVCAASLLGKMLYGTAPWDAATLVTVAAVLGGSAMVASYLPARRAASVNPVEALRAE
ncbi:duplicated orphan permease [Granulicella pectinivorans]|uniref:Duplicated orphan permease n=1 Tax=Granulicella pectinivorans TaxID=474950 RepID=A0A1I6LK61_9BACT|nr:ABC transporter permease [Granulicella pectinivorans]SFS03758.1 duplicated orphan permease [Granulicella pectinivorans]